MDEKKAKREAAAAASAERLRSVIENNYRLMMDERKPWDELLARYQAVEAVPPDQATDATIDAAGELSDKLMAMPAPTPAALLWKLRYLLDNCNGSTSSWSTDFVAPVLADCERMLGGALDMANV